MDYSKVTMMEYQEKKRKIFESLGNMDCRGRCWGVDCGDCPFSEGNACIVNIYSEYQNPLKSIKVVMDYEIPIDWSKVEVDTPILVRSFKNKNWHKRYFAKYENNIVFAFDQGATSWSAENEMCQWVFAKLANIESEEQK